VSAFGDLRGRTAVVTGGASGLGRGIAEELISQGMQVVIADVETQALQRTAAQIGAVGIRTDVSDFESVQSLADQVRSRFGTAHVVCNNAGIGSIARIADLTIDDWKWMLGVNLWGVIHGIRAFLPMLRGNPEGGHIVNTASVGGFVTMPGLGAYAVTKYGIVALTETLAQELAQDGGRVGATVVCPGPIRTNIKTSSRNRPASLGRGALTDVDLEQSEFGARARWIEPREAAKIVVAAVRNGELYAFTHPEQLGAIEERLAGIVRGAQAIRPPSTG
jgi:NAD(P)-dependent dehydrogenase (short-subunit alcohol dehydrogenase family)